MYGIRHGHHMRFIDVCDIVAENNPWWNAWSGMHILEYNQGMLVESKLRARLPICGMGVPFYFLRTTTSTNEEAERLARQGAPHGTLVLAEEQTAGRGRAGRHWWAAPGSALTFSLVLRPAESCRKFGALNLLGALALAEALERIGLCARIKWPNDVLLEGKKTSGVLVHITWHGTRIDSVVMGIGLNVRSAAVPRAELLDFPATCVETVLGSRVDRSALLLDVLRSVGQWWPRVEGHALLDACERRLAFLGEDVLVWGDDRSWQGTLLGLRGDGSIRLRTAQGECTALGSKMASLRPVDRGAE
jgi:BirA family biotin operon repressor/biotin-[acetyl-CoA-carboxylase] ligase